MSADEGEEELTGSHLKNWVDSDAKIPQGNSEGSIMKHRKAFFRCMHMQRACPFTNKTFKCLLDKHQHIHFFVRSTSIYTAGFQVC